MNRKEDQAKTFAIMYGMRDKPFSYLEKEPTFDAPVCDNPSGLYCPSCRRAGFLHCAHPEYCGSMRLMKPVEKNNG